MEEAWLQFLARVRDMSDFFESEACNSRANCGQCRGEQPFRQLVIDAFDTPTDIDFDCPFGMVGCVTDGLSESFLRMMRYNQALTRRDLTIQGGGDPDTSAEVRDAQLAICQACPSGKFVNGVCMHDNVPVTDKAGWATEDCFYGHW